MKEFFVSNRDKLNEHLSEGDYVVLFSGVAPKSTADSHYVFLPDKNFYYFTGLNKENFAVVMYKENSKIDATLFIEKPNYDVEKWYGRKLKKETAIEISGIENVSYMEELTGFVNSKIFNNKVNRVFLDLQKLSWDEEDSLCHKFAEELKKRYSFLDIQTIHPIVSELRVIKSDFELEKMKKAIEITKDGLEAIMNYMKPGVFEYQVESIFNHSIMMNGADRNSFPTIAASGEDAVILHYVENNKQIKDGDLVLIDLGAQFEEYAADITRTYPANGKFTERQKQIYDIVLKAQMATIDSMKPGIKFTDLNDVCKKVLAEELKAIGLIECDEDLSKYYYHGVSHHLGLDVHDVGSRELTLEPGMVFTVEPGLYIAEEGIGIRIEDDVLITDDGHKNLSEAIIKTTEDIEKFMSK